MNEVILLEALQSFFGGDSEDAVERLAGLVRDAQSFEETGVLTASKGLTVRAEDGSEYQITIVQSR